jgi:hypothetical protein
VPAGRKEGGEEGEAVLEEGIEEELGLAVAVRDGRVEDGCRLGRGEGRCETAAAGVMGAMTSAVAVRSSSSEESVTSSSSGLADRSL